MELKREKYSVGVIVARFQINKLHEAHKELIDTVLKEHPTVLIFLGLSMVKGSTKNPLPFQPRKQMLLEAFPPKDYPNLTIGYIEDNRSDEIWSINLDRNISKLISIYDSVVLYGSRDSFLSSYKGRFPTRELASNRHVSGTAIREELSKVPQSDPLFRAGAIWHSYQRYPSVFPTVDVACIHDDGEEVLLIKKPGEAKWRFPGGFASPNDASFEEAADRELQEETGMIMSRFSTEYLGSFKIDDWRYKNEVDKIITNFYFTIRNPMAGPIRANDDASEAAWVNIKKTTINDIMPEHHVLWNVFLDRITNGKRRLFKTPAN